MAGQLVPIITFEPNGALRLHNDNADRILSKITPNKKVAVLGICGNARMGKSFLLNALLFGLQNPEVLNRADTVFGGSSGIPFNSGQQAHTKGILWWSEPIEISPPNGEALSVILMDTQGTFDLENNRVVSVEIFALGNLLSSTLIFNKMRLLDHSDLEALQQFVSYGACLGANTGQHLVCLLRDFYNESDGSLNEEYMEQIREGGSGSTEIIQCLDDIEDAFYQFSCFTLTTPERALQVASTEIRLSECGQEFIQGVKNFVTFIRESIRVKEINGTPIYAKELGELLKVSVKTIKNGDAPEIQTALESMEQISLLEAERECRELFQRELDAVPRVNISSENFEQMVNRASTSAMEGLRLKRMFCTPANRRLLSDRLHREFQTAAQRQIEIFERNKREQEEHEKEKRRLSMERWKKQRRLEEEHRERMERLDRYYRERKEQEEAERREREEKDREIRRRLERKVDECVSGAFVAPERQRHFGKYSNGTHYAILVTEGLWYKVRLFKMGDSFSCSLTDTEHITEEGMRERVREIKA